MTTISPPVTAQPSRVIHGIICVEIGMLVFVLQDAMMKSLLEVYSVWFLVFLRSVVSFVVLVPLILWLGAPHRLRTPFWRLHAIRGVLFALGFSLFYTAFPFMGLAEVTTIFFSSPLITAVLASVFLKETIGPHRAGALLVGFVGILIAMNPTSDAFSWIAILPLICALTYAIGQIIARQIGDRESTLTVGLFTLSFSGLFILPFGWLVTQIVQPGDEFRHLQMRIPTEIVSDWPLLLLMGCTGMVGYLLLSRAYQVANASLIAPFDYSYLPMAAVLGYLLWDEVPPSTTLIGMGLIICSGVYLGTREIRAARKTDEPPIVADTIFVPGSPLVAQLPEAEQAYEDDTPT